MSFVRKDSTWIICILILILSLVAGIFITGIAVAYDAPPKDQGHTGPDPYDDDETKCPEDICAKRGSPVYVETGSYIYSHQDLVIPGRGESLEVTRRYDSHDLYDGPFGYGWKFNAEVRLTETTDESGKYANIRRDDGIRLNFTMNTDGSYTAPQGRRDYLTKNSDSSFTWCEAGCTACGGYCYNFDTSGYLSNIKDSNNNQKSFNYDSTGKLIQITDASGRQLTITYGSNNKIASIKDPANRTFSYGYDSSGNLTSYTDPMGNTMTYAYDADHNLTGITEARGNTVTTITYDSDDRVKSYTEYGGTWTYSYDPQNNTTYKDDSDGNRWTFVYNDTGQSVSETDPMGNTITNTWDDNINLTSVTDARGFKTTYSYDGNGNRLTETDALGNTVSFTYDLIHNKLATVKDPLERVMKYEYDSKGNVIKVIRDYGGSLENETTFTYDSEGETSSIADPLGNTSLFTYDIYGNLTLLTDPLGNTTISTYNVRGNLLTQTDALGNTTTYTNDLLNRITSKKDALGKTTSFTYDSSGNFSTLTDPDGNATTYTYDAFNNLLQSKDALNNEIRYTYNSRGQKTSTTDANGNKTTYNYDMLGRLVSVTNAIDETTSYGYDANWNLISMTDATGNKATYTVDSLNRISQITYPDGLTKSYTYDQLGTAISVTNRKGDTITSTYDSLNRPIATTYPDDTKVTYVYDVLGRLSSAANKNSTIQFGYDALNRVVSSNQDGKTVLYDYDSTGNRIKLIYPDGSYYNYSFDPVGRLDQIMNSTGQVIADYTYNSLRWRARLDLLNGTKTTYQYDQVGRLTSLVTKVPDTDATVSSFAYTYDKAENRSTMTTLAGHYTHTYDNISQLTGVDYPDSYPFPDTTYNFGAVGNRTSTVNGGTINYTTNNMNQYTAVGATAYTYDENGSLTSDGTNTYQYDYDKRLVQVNTPTDTISFLYGPLGRRISKTINGSSSTFIYDGNRVIKEIDNTGQSITYVYGSGLDEVLAMRKNIDSSIYYYHYDGSGSVRNITDENGDIEESYAYDVYGAPYITDRDGGVLSESSIGNSYLYTGRRFEKESGIYYYRARYYDPQMGRFLQADPLEFSNNLNLYSYVKNNPVNWIDPYGYSGDSLIPDAYVVSLSAAGFTPYAVGGGAGVELVWIPGKGFRIFVQAGPGLGAPGGSGALEGGIIWDMKEWSDYTRSFVELQGSAGFSGSVFGWGEEGPKGFKVGGAAGTPGGGIMYEWYIDTYEAYRTCSKEGIWEFIRKEGGKFDDDMIMTFPAYRDFRRIPLIKHIAGEMSWLELVKHVQ